MKIVYKSLVFLIIFHLFLIVVVAFIYGSKSHKMDHNIQSYGFLGSVKGRIFSGKNAASYFHSGINGITINIQNHGRSDNLLEIYNKNNGLEFQNTIAPGIKKIQFKHLTGLNHLRFNWASEPKKIILTEVDSKEYFWFRKIVYNVFFLAIMLLFVLILNRDLNIQKLFMPVFCILFAIYFYTFDNSVIPITGDEPHYMLSSKSIVNDLDLDLKNQYDQKQFHVFFPSKLDRHIIDIKNSQTSIHYPLLSLLISPAYMGSYFSLQINQYVISKLIIVLFSTMMVTCFILFIHSITRDIRVTVFSGVQFLFLPFLAYSNQIYPEIIAGGFLLLIFVYFIFQTEKNFFFYLALLAIMLLPFVHIKFALLALVCGVILLLKNYKNKNQLLFSIFSLLVAVVLIIYYNLSLYQNVLGPYIQDDLFFTNGFWLRYLVYLIDADLGLFSLNPLLLWVIPGYVYLFYRLKNSQSQKLPIHRWALAPAIILPFIAHVPNALHINWLLGSCPAGRYWIAAIPLYIFISALGFSNFLKRNQKRNYLWILFPTFFLLILAMLGSLAFTNNQELFYLPLKIKYIVSHYLSGALDLSFLQWSYPKTMNYVHISFWMILLFYFMILSVPGKKKM